MDNLRSLHIEIDGSAKGDPRAWLEAQFPAVKRGTRIDGNGVVWQHPFVAPGAYVDPSAMLLGGVIVGSGCYVGPCAVIRLDEKPSVEPLIIGEETTPHQGSYVGEGIALPPERYVAPGQEVMAQQEADGLGAVPAALKALRAHVLARNKAHALRYREQPSGRRP
jgi:hypothetical protein